LRNCSISSRLVNNLRMNIRDTPTICFTI